MKEYIRLNKKNTFDKSLRKNSNSYNYVDTQDLLDNTFEYYKNVGKALIVPHQLDCSIKEYVGIIKSGKGIYFAFVDDINKCGSFCFNSFITKSKKVLDLGGIVFVLLCNHEKAYRIPCFVLDSFNTQPDKPIINLISSLEIESTKPIIDFLQKDIYECTIAGENYIKQNKTSKYIV